MQWHQVRGNRTPKELMQANMIVKHISGSNAYGTNIEGSDIDMRGVFSADPINILTPWYVVKETEVDDEDDTKLYELKHFMGLCLNCNPNIIETLWVAPEDVIVTSDAYTTLRDARFRLLSKKVAFTFSGYAYAQLERMKGHNKWINNPQAVGPPQQVDFVSLVQWFGESKVLPNKFNLRKYRDDFRLVPYGNHIYGLYGYTRGIPGVSDFSTKDHQTFADDGTLNTVFEGERHTMLFPGAIVKFNHTEYKHALQNHKQYWEWKRDRNPVRAALEEKFGYDTKHAMHLFRLMRMGQEILETGQVNVRRPDAEELVDIRVNGSISYDEIVKYAEHMDHQIRKVWYKKSDLRKVPDIKFAANLLMDIQEQIWDTSGE